MQVTLMRPIDWVRGKIAVELRSVSKTGALIRKCKEASKSKEEELELVKRRLSVIYEDIEEDKDKKKKK